VRELIDRKRVEVKQRIDHLLELQQVLDGLAQRAVEVPAGSPEEGEGICHTIERGFRPSDTMPATAQARVQS